MSTIQRLCKPQFLIWAVAGCLVLLSGCPGTPPTEVDPCTDVTCEDGFACEATTGECVAEASDDFANASAVRGGSLYDKWWAVDGVTADEPTEDHAFWSMQTTNERMGSDTWRCKECHGWDYKGVEGAYASGSHTTGFAGIFGTTMAATDVFSLLGADHGYQGAGLSDGDLWDLTKFVLEGQIDTDDILDGRVFNGTAESGEALFASACAACHGADGLTPPPGADADFDDVPGHIADDNPWEYQHKVRFGQPGSVMPPQHEVLTLTEIADLAAFSQTLPQDVGETTSPMGDADAGEAFFVANGCTVCHGEAAEGNIGPSLVGVGAGEVFDHNTGVREHPGGTVEGITEQNAEDVATWLASL